MLSALLCLSHLHGGLISFPCLLNLLSGGKERRVDGGRGGGIREERGEGEKQDEQDEEEEEAEEAEERELAEEAEVRHGGRRGGEKEEEGKGNEKAE